MTAFLDHRVSRNLPDIGKTDHLTGDSQPRNTKRSLSTDQVTYLNIIRMMAAQLVLFHHAFLYFPQFFKSPIALGSLGVDLFFLISGFLIGRSVIMNITRPDFGLSTYLIERFARIYTAYLPALLTVVLVDYFLKDLPDFPDRNSYTLWNGVGNLLMLQDFSVLMVLNHIGYGSWFIETFSSAHPFWTLPIEWWIYVTFGLLFFSIRNRSWTMGRLILLALVSLHPLYHFIARYSGSLTGVWIMGF